MTEKILVALDLSHSGARVLETAREMAARRGAKLIAITVLPAVPAIVDSYMASDYQDKAVEETRTALVERLRERGLAPEETEIVIRHGSPYGEVINYAKEAGVDLIVVGSHAPKTPADYLLGSTAAKVVRHAPCSVFVVRT